MGLGLTAPSQPVFFFRPLPRLQTSIVAPALDPQTEQGRALHEVPAPPPDEERCRRKGKGGAEEAGEHSIRMHLANHSSCEPAADDWAFSKSAGAVARRDERASAVGVARRKEIGRAHV